MTHDVGVGDAVQRQPCLAAPFDVEPVERGLLRRQAKGVSEEGRDPILGDRLAIRAGPQRLGNEPLDLAPTHDGPSVPGLLASR